MQTIAYYMTNMKKIGIISLCKEWQAFEQCVKQKGWNKTDL